MAVRKNLTDMCVPQAANNETRITFSAPSRD
jgi:hypothetical protein